jgi:hypothetical protein
MRMPRSRVHLTGFALLIAGALSLLGVLLGHALAGAFVTCTDSWVGSTGGNATNWNIGSNWSTGHQPTSSDFVCLSSTPVNTNPTIASGNTGNAGGIDFTSGTLTDDGTLNIGAQASTLSNLDVPGTLNLAASASVTTTGFTLDASQTGVLNGAATSTLTVNGAGLITQGASLSAATLTAGATGTITLGTNTSSATLYMYNNAKASTVAGGKWALTSSSDVTTGDSSTPTMNIVQGATLSFAARSVGDNAYINVPITMNGTGNVSGGGLLDLQQGGSIGSTASATTTSGSEFAIESTFNEPTGETGSIAGMTIESNGTLASPGAWTVPAGATATDNAGTISGTTLTVAAGGNLAITNGNSGWLYNSAQLVVDGTLTFGTNSLLQDDGSSVLLTVAKSGVLSYPDVTSSDTAYINVPMADDGTASVAHATLDFEGNGTVGPDQHATGAGVWEDTGTLNATGGLKTSVGSLSGITAVGSATFDGPGILEVPKGSSVTWDSATLGAAVHFENFGTVSGTANDNISINSGSVWENESGGLFVVHDGWYFYGDGSVGEKMLNDQGADLEYVGTTSNSANTSNITLYSNGELQVSGGGQMYIATLVVSPTSTVTTSGGGTVLGISVSPPGVGKTGNINGLTLDSSSTLLGPGTLQVASGMTSYFAGVTLDGAIVVQNNGTINIPNGESVSLNHNSQIQNYGTFNSGDGSNIYTDLSASEIINESTGNMTYRGSNASQTATVQVPIDNLGTINAAVGQYEIWLVSGTFTPLSNGTTGILNTGTYTAGTPAGATGILDITTSAQIANGSTTSEGSPFISTNKATLDISPSGEIETSQGTLAQGLINNDGTISNGATQSLVSKLTQSGTLNITGKTFTAPSYSLTGNSVTNVAASGTLSAGATGAGVLTLAAPTTGQKAPVLSGNGTVAAVVSNGAGVVSPTAGSAGALHVKGSYTQTPVTGGSPQLAAEVVTNGTTAGTDFSQLAVSGTATLGGTLALSTGSGYKPAAGESYTILTASKITGTFASVTGGAIGSSGDFWTVVYGATSVVIEVSPPSVKTISPAIGQGATKAPVTLTGLGFVSGDTVTSGNPGVTFSSVTVKSLTSATALETVTATATVGKTSVTVHPPTGATFGCASCATIDAKPTVSKIAPNVLGTGTVATVTVTGTGYNSPSTHPLSATVSGPGTGVTAKLSGTVSATTFKLSVTVPASAKTGKYSLNILNGDYGVGGCSSCVTIEVIPSIATFSPAKVVQGASGVAVTITGSHFLTGATLSASNTGVTFSSVTVASATKITAKMAVKSTATVGAVAVTVQDTGQGKATKAAAFTIDAPPLPKSLSPSSLPANSIGKTVKVNGTGFAAGAKVAFSPSTGMTIKVVSVTSTVITLTVSVASTAKVGSYSVTVTNTDGGKGTCTNCFKVT